MNEKNKNSQSKRNEERKAYHPPRVQDEKPLVQDALASGF